MKGKRRFTPAEASLIRATLLERPRTKETRDKLRRVGFYISDFGMSPPFSTEDFERFVRSGEVEIVGGTTLASTESPAVEAPPPMPQAATAAEEIRLKYRPPQVRVLLLGESVPSGGTFFYEANPLLFRHTQRAFNKVFEPRAVTGTRLCDSFRSKGFTSMTSARCR